MYTLAPLATSVEVIINPIPYSLFKEIILERISLARTEPPPVMTATTPRRLNMLLAVKPPSISVVFAIFLNAIPDGEVCVSKEILQCFSNWAEFMS
jgi:hypothetical protein